MTQPDRPLDAETILVFYDRTRRWVEVSTENLAPADAAKLLEYALQAVENALEDAVGATVRSDGEVIYEDAEYNAEEDGVEED
jgi:hypothetical protein